jgi:phage head maturation protease
VKVQYGVDLMPMNPHPNVIRTAVEGSCLGGVVSRDGGDPRRRMAGSWASWGPTLTNVIRQPGGDAEACFLDITLPSIRDWFSRTDPADVPLLIDHDGAGFGRGVAMTLFDDGLSGIVVCDDVPAGDLALRLANEGPMGLSIGARLVRWHEAGQYEGLPLIVADVCEIGEISVVSDPSDDDSWVTRVGGEECHWFAVQEARDRTEVLRRMVRV